MGVGLGYGRLREEELCPYEGFMALFKGSSTIHQRAERELSTYSNCGKTTAEYTLTFGQ